MILNKKDYFKLIRKITKELKTKGLSYVRVYSEPHRNSNYRTKIYSCEHRFDIRDNLRKFIDIINEEYGNIVTASISTSRWQHDNIIIKTK